MRIIIYLSWKNKSCTYQRGMTMLFWIFMLVMNLLIPISMIGFGKLFMKTTPKEINGLFGYRTSMSMKNKDTWIFAHHYCGNCGMC